MLAEERASIERLLTAISATLNRDLPAKLQEAVRGELAGMADGLAAGVATSLAPAVQAAVQAALPKVRPPGQLPLPCWHAASRKEWHNVQSRGA